MNNRLNKLLLDKPYIYFIFSILYHLVLNKTMALCDIFDWNPGKFLLSDPIVSTNPSNADREMNYCIPEFIKKTADLLLSNPETALELPSSAVEVEVAEIVINQETTRDTINMYKLIISTSITKEELADESFKFVAKTVPSILWNKTTENMGNSDDPLVIYVDSFSEQIDITDETNLKALISYRSAVVVYNEMVASKTDYSLNKHQLVEQFYRCIYHQAGELVSSNET